MANKEPNDKQQQLIESVDGIYLVDAGAGTGKTFALTRRYAHLLQERQVEPENVLLITFTENAAQQMQDKAIEIADHNVSRLREAPISTFHSFCKQLLEREGQNVPQLLGIDNSLSSSIRIIENRVQELEEFNRFYNRFKRKHAEHEQFYPLMARNKDQLLDLIKSLGAKGIVPQREGWFKTSRQYLLGAKEEYEQLLQEVNRPRGNKQSRLRKKLGSLHKDKCYETDAPTKVELRGERGTKTVDQSYLLQAFDRDREHLLAYIHDLFFEYIAYCLERDYLNFSLLQVLALALLMEDDRVHQSVQFDYVMVDEFQDTSEIQFKLMMLLAGDNNICAVGDWKQSIFSFQYANVDNILSFEDNLTQYKQELNQDRERIAYKVEQVETISLNKNYRSSQAILDFSETSLTLKGQSWERLDTDQIKEEITSLNSEVNRKNTKIHAFKSEEELDAILYKIEEIVDNPEYQIETEDGELKKIDYSDIAVLSRTKKFGLQLQKKAQELGLPVAYEGGIRLFETDPALILLAWFRILENEDSRRGWSVLLDQIGYTLPEIKSMLDNKNYPDNLLDFLQSLKETQEVGTLIRSVFDRYGLEGEVASKLIEVIETAFSNSYMDLGRLIEFMEKNIEAGETYDIDSSTSRNVVKVQTIHKAKGLEYPVVFMANLNQRNFPSISHHPNNILYTDLLGLRQKKIYHDSNLPYLYDNWKADVLLKGIDSNYDEERRLLYVAMTRAKNYLFFTAEEGKESLFFEKLGLEPETLDETPEQVTVTSQTENELSCKPTERKRPIKLPVHAIMQPVESPAGRGREFGQQVHQFAEQLVRDGERTESGLDSQIVPTNQDEEYVKQFVTKLQGRLMAEEKITVPYQAGGRKVVLSGCIDLISIKEDKVKLIDFKTDINTEGEEEYRKQLSVYCHGLEEVFPEKEVTPFIYYTYQGNLKEIAPLDKEELAKTSLSLSN